jgi:hypothetical protein
MTILFTNRPILGPHRFVTSVRVAECIAYLLCRERIPTAVVLCRRYARHAQPYLVPRSARCTLTHCRRLPSIPQHNLPRRRVLDQRVQHHLDALHPLLDQLAQALVLAKPGDVLVVQQSAQLPSPFQGPR